MIAARPPLGVLTHCPDCREGDEPGVTLPGSRCLRCQPIRFNPSGAPREPEQFDAFRATQPDLFTTNETEPRT